MPVKFKDYYQILGVDRSASAEAMRSAFRNLARQYHPDLAGNDPVAEARFKEINEAYEVLSDTRKRSKYDSLGHNWSPGADFRPPPGFARAGSQRPRTTASDSASGFSGTGFSDFFESLFGSEVGSTEGADSSRDGAPGAFGKETEADLLVTLQEALHGAVRPVSVERESMCPSCFGTSQVNGRACPSCHGKGYRVETQTYQVKVPAGVRNGSRLRLPGRGGSATATSRASDLILRVRYERHPHFEVDQENLHCEINVAPWEAVLGVELDVPTLEGIIQIRIPPGSQNGQRMRLRERGLRNDKGRRGDLIVQLRIRMPTQVSDRERSLWEQMARESSFHARR